MYLKLNIAQLARETGVKYRTMYSYVRGEKRPRYETADHLEKTTGIGALIWLKGDPVEIQAALEASPLSNN